jgi:hypothetical protein
MKIASYSDTERATDYEVGYGKPPRRAGFQKGRSGNPKGRPKGSKNLATLLGQALDEKVHITEDGKRRRITKRELVIRQLVNKSAAADLRAIKQLTDIVEGVIAELRKRIERDIRAKLVAETTSLIVAPADPRDGQRHASFETAATRLPQEEEISYCHQR